MDDIIKDLSDKYKIDQRVIKLICYHPLLFAKRIIEDPSDERAIMIKYFGKFILKYNKTSEDKKINVDKYLYKKSIAKEKKLLKKQNITDTNTVVLSS